MTSKGNGKRQPGSSWSERIARQHCADALRFAIRKARGSHPAVARWVGRSERTVRYWLEGKRAITADAVLRSGRLRRNFLRYLVVCDRK